MDMENTLNLMLVNNTGHDIRLVEKAIYDAIGRGEELPEEISDIFVIRKVAEFDNRWTIEWA